MNRDFKGIWIPKRIWLDKTLGWSEKLLLVEIDSLDNEHGCWANNSYFAEFFNLSKDRVSRIINKLKEKGYIEVTIYYVEGTKQVDKRIIKVNRSIGENNDTYMNKKREGIGENNDTPIGENTKDNNTSFNNTFNNTNNTRKQIYETDSIHFQLSNHFFQLIKNNNPDHKQPNLQKWSDEIRKMIEIDKRTPEQIKYLMTWVQNNEFEMANVLSPAKLRKRFDDLVMKCKREKGGRNGINQPPADSKAAKYNFDF